MGRRSPYAMAFAQHQPRSIELYLIQAKQLDANVEHILYARKPGLSLFRLAARAIGGTFFQHPVAVLGMSAHTLGEGAALSTVTSTDQLQHREPSFVLSFDLTSRILQASRLLSQHRPPSRLYLPSTQQRPKQHLLRCMSRFFAGQPAKSSFIGL